MDLQLAGKVALVTGASHGIGSAIARALVAEGCFVAICGRTEETLKQAAEDISPTDPTRVLPIVADVTQPAAAERFVRESHSAFGGVDILINNVGGNRRKMFLETTDEDWADLMELNLLSGLRLARAVVPLMRERQGGSVLFVSSLFGREAGGKGLTLYNTSKTAVISAAKIMAIELAPEKIRVNSIAPGSIQFPGGSWDRRVKEDPEGMAQFVSSNLPLGRFGTAEELAAVATFLVSPRASLVTGACIAADGAQGRSII